MMFNVLFLLIPAAAMVLAGVWGWRYAESMANSVPLDARTRERRRRMYKRGSVTCIVGALAFVVLIVISFN